MKRLFSRIIIIALVTFLFGTGVSYLTDLETALGLDTLFKLRGTRQPPAEVVVIAMDETSEDLLKVGHDLTHWRRFHTQLIHELKRQGVALVVFDLQFITAHAEDDPALAGAMREAGNVLVTDCVQKLHLGVVKDFYGREECSDSNNNPLVEKEGGQQQSPAEQLVVLLKIPPTPELATAALDHTPFFLGNDAEHPIIHEGWLFIDSLAKSPVMPVLAWFSILYRNGALAIPPSELPLSAWLAERRRQCSSNLVKPVSSQTEQSTLQQRIDKVICGEDTRYLDFYGPPQTIRMESYSAVYAGKMTDLKDKVVFVGKANRKYSPGKTDFFPTPFSSTRSGEMAGVEIMATEFANLWEDRFVMAPFPHAFLLLAFGLLLGLILIVYTGLTGLLASILFSAAYAGAALWLFSRHGLWLPVAVPILIQLPLAILMALVWSRLDLLAERTRILAFVRQVFPQWINFVPSSPGQWYPETSSADFKVERDVKGLCLATDIEGYTSVAARYTPHQMWELLSDYYQILGHSILAQKGIIADITGDAMMAVWIELPDHARRTAACLAALDMERAVGEFNATSTAGHLPTRIGLHEGDMTLGRLGTGAVSHYRAIGDAINIASRIQGVNKYLGTNILASEEIVANLEHVVCRRVGNFRLIGRNDPVTLFEVAGLEKELTGSRDSLHQKFAVALGLFEKGVWADAASQFQHLRDEFGGDGPTKFYLALSVKFETQPPLTWDGVVTLDGK